MVLTVAGIAKAYAYENCLSFSLARSGQVKASILLPVLICLIAIVRYLTFKWFNTPCVRTIFTLPVWHSWLTWLYLREGESVGRWGWQILTWNFTWIFFHVYLKKLCRAYHFLTIFPSFELTECVLWTVLIYLNVKLPTWNEVCTCGSCVTFPTLEAA